MSNGNQAVRDNKGPPENVAVAEMRCHLAMLWATPGKRENPGSTPGVFAVHYKSPEQ